MHESYGPFFLMHPLAKLFCYTACIIDFSIWNWKHINNFFLGNCFFKMDKNNMHTASKLLMGSFKTESANRIKKSTTSTLLEKLMQKLRRERLQQAL